MSKVKSSVHQTLAELFQQVSTGKLEPSEFEQKLAFLDGFTGGSSAEVASKPVSFACGFPFLACRTSLDLE
jgi:hypothetical protein